MDVTLVATSDNISICHDNSRDGKEPSLLGFGTVRVLPSVKVLFGSSSLQLQKISVRFRFGSDVLCLQLCSVPFCVGSKNV